ncbi:MAG: bifunctional (p)ppGpp synthetase/guanosine-3',5'-bis(diphosphate) 3'-pyrophosphohydrolase [Candidatus Altimarinota bacterium]
MEQNVEIKVDYTSVDKKVDKLIKNVCLYLSELSPDYIENEIKKAYLFARDAHHGVMRLSGDPYINHPVEATQILLDLKPDLYTIQACILHDVIEDTPRTYEDILLTFGEEVARICAGMEKLSKVRYFGEERTVGSLRKMFVAMSEDIRVIFVKLSDRLHNMKTLKYHPKKEKRERIALETLNIYAPIADRLGLHKFKNMLDEECFKILFPNDYRQIKRELTESNETMTSFQKNAKLEIENILKATGIEYMVDFRVKSIYSIYKKLKRKNLEKVSDLYDLYGIKILVNDVSDCYKALGLVHSFWTPLPKRFKDYIALPKPNGYQSLHTTVVGLLKKHRQQPTEIQIKTFDMELRSSIGVAAHFEYKEKGSKMAQDIDWVRQLKDLTENLGNNEFMDSLKIDLFKDRIFVLTPRGDNINLPAGSTPIDFAYEIHTDLGNHITIAKINGQPSPLDKELKNGDVVEVITDKNKKPNPFYISFVKTTKAKNCIRSFLRNEDKELHIERGREILNNLLGKAGIEKLDKDLTVLKTIDDRTYSVDERIDILEQVGNFSTNPTAIVKKIFKTKKIQYKPKTPLNKTQNIPIEIDEKKSQKDIIIGGEKNMPYKVGVCCQDKLADKIVAYINSKGVITIHNRDCKTLYRLSKDRLLSAYYEGDELNNIIFDINFIFANKIGVLKNLSDILFDMNINTLEILSKREGLEKTSLYLKLEILDHDYLIIDRFLERVKFKLGNNLLDFEVKKIGNN